VEGRTGGRKDEVEGMTEGRDGRKVGRMDRRKEGKKLRKDEMEGTYNE
jgi:hypothetical protein